MKWILCLIFSFSLIKGAEAKSDLIPTFETIEETKFPNNAFEGEEPVVTSSMVAPLEDLRGFKDLLPFVTSSPYQDEAGSCLYMALTGMAEWWLNKMNPHTPSVPNGVHDLSERHLMNVAGIEESTNGVPNWKTDSIFLFNRLGYGISNTAFRFTKGWYKTDKTGNYVEAKAQENGATYGTSFNWINQLHKVKGGKVQLPSFKREVIFADPDSDQWNTVVTPENIVEEVQQKLMENKAPILVIYNHYGYWHADLIVGFDNEASHDCAFVAKFPKTMKEKAVEYRKEAAQTKDPVEKDKLLKRAVRYEKNGARVETAYQENGQCSGKGVFFVRDSLYPDPALPRYNYDLRKKGEEEHLVKKVVLREFEWLRYLANHVVQISPQTTKGPSKKPMK